MEDLMRPIPIVLTLLALASLLACATLADREVGSPTRVGPRAEGGAQVSWRAVEQEVELGQVRWQRDYDAARKQALETGRPLFVLFDEVPG